MRRARIKATVSVPARKKANQETVLLETTSISSGSQDANETKPIICLKKEVLANDMKEEKVRDIVTDTPVETDVTENCEKIIEDSCSILLESSKPSDPNDLKISKCNPLTTIANDDEQDYTVALAPENHTSDDTNPDVTWKDKLLKSKSEQTVAAEPSDSQSRTPGGSVKIPQNRSCFMRPTPRLGSNTRLRRNSIQGSGASASESEDDSRRTTNVATSRVRNDSTCSVQSAKETTGNVSQSSTTVKEKIVPKRRMLISESARKLAEARREFHIKHENKTPDRSKLTMYDLIYYNPVSNPMKPKNKESEFARKVVIDPPDDVQEEEKVDDPSSAMPVPQVKVGPDGQLIIDEQSLVIEQSDAKRNREVLAKEAIIDDDNTGSGFYKKRQKSKEWPKWETLKFYKALNTVGTDFLLMQSLFPKRSRQEIKLKFKKEEKINRPLVEKALAYHQEFDTDTLEKSLATFETSEREYISAQESRDSKKKAHTERKRKSRIVAASIAEMDGSDDDEHETDSNNASQFNTSEKSIIGCQNNLENLARKSFKKIRRDKDTESVIDLADVKKCRSSGSRSDSDGEIYHIRPTRSGRKPKVKMSQDPSINNLDDSITNEDQDNISLALDTKQCIEHSNNENDDRINHKEQKINIIKNATSEVEGYEPDSVVDLSNESANGPEKNVLKVYMVSSNMTTAEDSQTNITPIDLSPEPLATVSKKLSDTKSIDMKE